MKTYVCNKVSLTHYTNDIIRLDGSVLNGIDVLAWTRSVGKRLIWMDEVGDLHNQPTVGFILVRWADVARKDVATAQRAILTNCYTVLYPRRRQKWAATTAFCSKNNIRHPAPSRWKSSNILIGLIHLSEGELDLSKS